MNTNIMICMRCGAWHNGHCNQRECGINGALKKRNVKIKVSTASIRDMNTIEGYNYEGI